MPASRRHGKRMPPDQPTLKDRSQRPRPHIRRMIRESRRFCVKTLQEVLAVDAGASARNGEALRLRLDDCDRRRGDHAVRGRRQRASVRRAVPRQGRSCRPASRRRVRVRPPARLEAGEPLVPNSSVAERASGSLTIRRLPSHPRGRRAGAGTPYRQAAADAGAIERDGALEAPPRADDLTRRLLSARALARY
jgi:hypothetical protein